MWVFPDGFAPLFRAAAALPALLGTPVLEVLPAALPVVVPPVGDPAVVPPAAPPVLELPPGELPDCAKAKEFVKASAAANPSVASFMIAPFLGSRNGATRCARMRSFSDNHRSLLFPR